MNKLSDAVNNEFEKVNNVDTSGFILKTKYDTDKSSLEKKISDANKKIPNISKLVKKTDYNSQITDIESKIPIITGLAPTASLTSVENKIPNVSDVVEKTMLIWIVPTLATKAELKAEQDKIIKSQAFDSS